LLRDYAATGALDFLPRRLPPPVATLADLGVVIETKVVRGDLTNGRRPYIELDRVHYTSPLLASAFGLVGKRVRIHIRESNMCSVAVYHESGEELGILTAQGAWGRTVHTREMRKHINALRDSGELVVGYHDNPVVALLKYLGSETHRDAEKKPTKVSRNATKLACVVAASGLPMATADVTAKLPAAEPMLSVVPTPAASSIARPLSVMVKPPQWKTIIR
jgi:hypothetical protein